MIYENKRKGGLVAVYTFESSCGERDGAAGDVTEGRKTGGRRNTLAVLCANVPWAPKLTKEPSVYTLGRASPALCIIYSAAFPCRCYALRDRWAGRAPPVCPEGDANTPVEGLYAAKNNAGQ